KLPVARIVSKSVPDYRPDSRKPLEEDIEEGLLHTLKLQIGCPVMLRTNICVDKGLVNGSAGILRAIVYAPGERPPALPLYVLVAFNKYRGPYMPEDSRLFPIVPITRCFIKNNVKFYRT